MLRKAILLVLSIAMAGQVAACNNSSTGEEGVLPGVQSLVFMRRAFIDAEGNHQFGGMGNIFDYNRYVPGGGIYTLTPPTPDGVLVNLTEGFEDVDVSGLDLSFDAQEIVFSMRHAGDDRFHIWAANIDGTNMRQLTFGPSTDVSPIFAPEDRVLFITNQPYTDMGTRADEYNHSRVVTQMAGVTLTGGDADRWVCQQHLSHTMGPRMMSDGRVLYSRWEHLGSVNDIKLFAMNPDCSNMMAVFGQFGKGFNSYSQAREIPGRPGEFVGIATPRKGTIQAGALVQVDARSLTSTDVNRLDVQTATYENITPLVPTGADSPASGVGRFRQPFPMADGRMLVSWADGPVNERLEITGTAPDFGIYLFDPESGEKTLIFNGQDTWDTYAIPVAPRDVPPLLGDFRGDVDPNTPSILGSVDVSITSLDENVSGGGFDGTPLNVALGEAHRVRIIEGFSSEIGPVRQFGLTNQEGAAIVGEALVHEDGSWEAAVPSRLPYHLQAIDQYGLAIRNQRVWIQADAGEARRCGGCHASRSENILPASGATTLAQQAGAEDFNVPIAERMELPWYNAADNFGTPHTNIQDLFDAKCVSCHSGGAGDPFAGQSYSVEVTAEDGSVSNYEIPVLDLSDRAMAVYYEREVVDFPVSYISLMYASSMMGDTAVTGGVAPIEWVIPANARGSRLVEAVNAVSEIDGSAAFDRPLHPEDVGVDLTRDERMMLIRMADLGAQYYSRRNVPGGFTASAGTDY